MSTHNPDPQRHVFDPRPAVPAVRHRSVTAMLAHLTPPGAVFVHGDRRFTLLRHHRAPKGKALIAYRRDGGGVGMQVLDDTDRLDVIELPEETP